MTKRHFWIFVALAGALWLTASPAFAQSLVGVRLYEQYCTTCHGNPRGPKNAQDELQLLKMPPEAVYAVLARSATHKNILGITDDDKRMVAGYLGGRKVGVAEIADAKKMKNRCARKPPMGDLSARPSWNGWGPDPSNSRFQPAATAGISEKSAPQLKLKWAFGFPAAEEVYGQPTIAGGRVFIGVDTGAVYSLDAATGCVYWSFQADAGVRNAISVATMRGEGAAKHAIYFGDIKANLYKVEAETGMLLWKVKAEENPTAHITGAPTLYHDRLYVPLASSEERVAGNIRTYPCCTFRGSVLAVDATTGRALWRTYIIPERPKAMRNISNGAQRGGPSGGGVWDSPTIDAKKHALYIGTGNAYTEPASNRTDAVVALDMDTGKVLWSVQDTENDTWIDGCGSPNRVKNCPKDLGPDYDFGSSPILRNLPDGHRILVAGQKSGMVWAHDPDQKGAVVWRSQLVEKLALGIITFGGAADDDTAYFGLGTGGLAAVKLTTGEKKWFAPEDIAKSSIRLRGQTAAITATPGVVFSGGWDGMLRGYSSADGRVLWTYDTARKFQTVNGVSAKGGSMGASGPTIAGGMLFAGSGYVLGDYGVPGNVLLAFGLN